MVKRWGYWFLTAAGVAAIVLAIFNATWFVRNRTLQADINSRQQFIVQSIQLEGLYREMVKALADLSAKTNDEELRGLLKAHGITFTVNPPAASAPPRGPRK